MLTAIRKYPIMANGIFLDLHNTFAFLIELTPRILSEPINDICDL